MTGPLAPLFPWLCAGTVVLMALVVLRRSLVRMLRLALRWLGGLAVLSVLSPIGQSLGLILGINPVNALVLGLLGTPGLALLLMLQWVFRTG